MPKFNPGDRVMSNIINEPGIVIDARDGEVRVAWRADDNEPDRAVWFDDYGFDLITPVADKYTVREEDFAIQTFSDIEMARAFRDGHNLAIQEHLDGEESLLFRITIDVEEVQTVTVTKDVE